MTVDSLAAVIQGTSAERIQSVLDELQDEYLQRSRGFVLAKVAGGYQFRSLPKIAPWILEMRRMKPARLSRAALETLSIVAYNQPVTKSRIEQIRGVESSAPLRSLVDAIWLSSWDEKISQAVPCSMALLRDSSKYSGCLTWLHCPLCRRSKTSATEKNYFDAHDVWASCGDTFCSSAPLSCRTPRNSQL